MRSERKPTRPMSSKGCRFPSRSAATGRSRASSFSSAAGSTRRHCRSPFGAFDSRTALPRAPSGCTRRRSRRRRGRRCGHLVRIRHKQRRDWRRPEHRRRDRGSRESPTDRTHVRRGRSRRRGLRSRGTMLSTSCSTGSQTATTRSGPSASVSRRCPRTSSPSRKGRSPPTKWTNSTSASSRSPTI